MTKQDQDDYRDARGELIEAVLRVVRAHRMDTGADRFVALGRAVDQLVDVWERHPRKAWKATGV